MCQTNSSVIINNTSRNSTVGPGPGPRNLFLASPKYSKIGPTLYMVFNDLVLRTRAHTQNFMLVML